MKKKRLLSGTIFWEKYKGYYYFFRIILDFKDVDNRGYNSKDDVVLRDSESLCIFDTLRTSYLVQVYQGKFEEPILPFDTPILINGIKIANDFQSKRYYEGEGCEVYGNESIQPQEIDCFEKISDDNLPYGRPNVFTKGNVNIPYFVRLSKNYKGGGGSFQSTELCDLANYLMGYGEMNEIGILYSYNNDLRCHTELREKVYAAIGEDIGISWYDLSLKHGFDLNVLFEERRIEDKSISLSSENNDKGVPKKLLQDFYWNFERKPSKKEKKFKRLASEYNESIAGQDLEPYWNDIVFSGQQLFIQIDFFTKSGIRRELLETDNLNGFTFFDLAYQIHMRIGKLKNTDQIFFEGLHFLSEKKERGKLIPVYSVVLGS